VVLTGNPLQSNWGSASSNISLDQTDIRYFGQQCPRLPLPLCNVRVDVRVDG
jgi:hypothetical protein